MKLKTNKTTNVNADTVKYPGLNELTIEGNEYLKHNIQGYYHIKYTKYNAKYKNDGNTGYLNDLKNNFNNFSKEKLDNAIKQLCDVLKTDLSTLFDKNLTICIIPRSKAENTYSYNQLLFKKTIQYLIEELNFQDGSNYIVRHTDTKTTHLNNSGCGGDGDMPYPGITKETCDISNKVKDKDILLIDDIYTKSINIDEDAIQALLDKGAKSVIFYAVASTKA